MKVLIAFASKHGSTAEIAAEIARSLNTDEIEADLLQAADVRSVSGYDGVVLGSAVYMGGWLKDARDLAAREAVALRHREVWLFSSGPIGDPPKHVIQAADISEVIELTRPREHRLFAGKLDRSRLGLAERSLMAALRVADGDFRDWPAIREWARTIRAEVTTRQSAGATPH